MKRFFAVAAIALALPVFGAVTVYETDIADSFGVARNARVTLEQWDTSINRPFRTSQTVLKQGVLYIPTLSHGHYQVWLGSHGPIKIIVPNATQTNTLTELAAFVDQFTFLATTNLYTIKVTSADTNAAHLSAKLVAGSNITITTNSPGASETLEIAATGGIPDGDKGQITVAGSGAIMTINNPLILTNTPNTVLNIGKASPSNLIEFAKDQNGITRMRIGNQTDDTIAVAGIQLDSAGADGWMEVRPPNSSSAYASRFLIHSGTGAGGATGITIGAFGSGDDVRIFAGGETAGDEAMRLRSGGQVYLPMLAASLPVLTDANTNLITSLLSISHVTDLQSELDSKADVSNLGNLAPLDLLPHTLIANTNLINIGEGTGPVDLSGNEVELGNVEMQTLLVKGQIQLTNSSFNLKLQAATLDAERTNTFPNATGTVVLNDNTATLSNKTLNTGANTIQVNTIPFDGTGGTLSLSAAQCYGSVVYVTGASTINLPAVAAGMSVTIFTIGSIAISVDPNAADKMVLDGVTLDDGDKATNTSTTGDMIVLTYYSADGWYAASNAWTDGGP